MAKSFSIIAYLGLKSKQFMEGLSGAKGGTKSAMGKMGGFVAKFAKAAALALVIAAAAMTAAIIKFSLESLKEFAVFEKGMLEVFTLLPNISKREMGKMTKDVLALSREMGVLTTDIVPALYQAISAGVPKENVIEFMQVASKAAIGGVTDLKTAVDGLTSVINAYGPANMSAEKAADIFFTTVKLGKTNFEELAASLYNVTPVASAVGISFEDVGAAIAALTAQGVPTAQATTQIRSAILSLTAPSNKARGVARMLGLDFEKLTAILAQPGGLKTAMELVMKATGGNMAKLKALMGRIEGVNGVVALSKNNFQSFSDAIIAQGRAAGAHVEAFDRMNAGLSRNYDMIKANVKATMIEVGMALAPIVMEFVPLIKMLADKLSKIDWKSIADGVMKWMGEVKTELRPIIDELIVAWRELVKASGPVVDAMRELWKGEGEKLKKGIVLLVQVFVALIKYTTALFTVFGALRKKYRELKESKEHTSQSTKTLLSVLGFLWNLIVAIVAPVFRLWKGFVKLAEALILIVKWFGNAYQALTDFINGFGPAQEKLYSFEYVWKKIKLTILQVFKDIWLKFTGFIDKVVEGFTTLKDSAIYKVMEMKNRIVEFVGGIWDSFKERFPRIAAVVEKAWDNIKEGFRKTVQFIKDAAYKMWDTFETVFPGLADTVKKVAQGMIDKFKKVFNFIKDKLGFLATIYEKFTGDVIDLEENMAEEIANIEQNAANESARFRQGENDRRKREMQEMVDERARKAKEAADLEEAIENEKIAAHKRALMALGAYETFLQGKSLEELEKILKKQGEAGENAMAQTTIQNEAQLARIQKAMLSLGHELVDIKKLTGEQLREMWLAEGEEGRKAYTEQIQLERRMAAEREQNASAALSQAEYARTYRSMNYTEMMAENKRRKDADKEAAKARKAQEREAATNQKKYTAEYKKQMQERYNLVNEYLFKQGSAVFRVNGMWIKANNSQQAIEKARSIARLRRLGEWVDAQGNVWKFEMEADKKKRERLIAQNTLIDMQGTKHTANLGTQKKILVQQRHQTGVLNTQVQLGVQRNVQATNYTNNTNNGAQALANLQKVQTNAVLQTFHMARYSSLYEQNLQKAIPTLNQIAALAAGMPGVNIAANMGASAGVNFGPVLALMRKMNTSLTSIDTSLKGKFVNQ